MNQDLSKIKLSNGIFTFTCGGFYYLVKTENFRFVVIITL